MSDHSGPKSHPDPKGAFGGSGAREKTSFVDAERRERARAARAAKVAAGAHLRRDFLDADHWRELARTQGCVLPYWHVAPTPKEMRRWLRRLGISAEDYKRWSGEHTLSAFAQRNPDWPARAWVGTVLEALDSGALQRSSG